MTNERLQQLENWWMQTARDDFEKIKPKIKEYASSDILAMGTAVLPFANDNIRTEVAIALYLQGKASRLVSSLIHNGESSMDSWLDSTQYARMGRFCKEFGSWL